MPARTILRNWWDNSPVVEGYVPSYDQWRSNIRTLFKQFQDPKETPMSQLIQLFEVSIIETKPGDEPSVLAMPPTPFLVPDAESAKLAAVLALQATSKAPVDATRLQVLVRPFRPA